MNRSLSLFRSVCEKYQHIGIRFGVALGMLGLIAGQPMTRVHAHQNPSGCNSNRFTISIVKDKTEVFQGDTLTYTVTAANVDFGADIACDLTNVAIQVTLPAADGTPTGSVVVLTPSTNYPAGSTTSIVGTVQYVVNVNPGVADIVAEARAQGTLHDAPVDHSALIVKTLGTTVVTVPAPTPPGGGGGSGSGSGTATKLPNTGTAAKL